ncbi:unnamed protein product [Effrenium voratum]|uniref:Uncharacterized protein n=1 Tax=Effrenium voratum TaxID=2562239 RepID=A0AA36HMX2_9DINO|nr:unnamed protein product [Effrenium voratum]
MGASSSEGPAILLEQSPARSKAPSDGPSEFSSWHDDASSSLAPSGTARDGTITVNPLVMRMGEHLKGKLQGMIRQRFDNYLHIIKTLQNDIGKLAALTCELRMTSRHASAAASVTPKFRISISCNEDGTFLVYTVPDAAGVLGSQCPGPRVKAEEAADLHQQVLKQQRLVVARQCKAKAVMVHQAVEDLERLHLAMAQQFSQMAPDRLSAKAPSAETSSAAEEAAEGERMVEALQQRLREQRATAERLRAQIAQAASEEQKSQEQELKLLAEAHLAEQEMRQLRGALRREGAP